MKAIGNDLSDEERRKAALIRLESLGWVFSVKPLARYCSAYNPKHRDGHKYWFNGPDALDKAIRFASMAQAKAKGSP